MKIKARLRNPQTLTKIKQLLLKHFVACVQMFQKRPTLQFTPTCFDQITSISNSVCVLVLLIIFQLMCHKGTSHFIVETPEEYSLFTWDSLNVFSS